jgi:hypothetical protein
MRSDILKRIEPGAPIANRKGASAWVPLMLLAFGVPWALWSASALLGSGGSQSVAFYAAAGWFVLLAIGYLGLHGLRELAWFSIPVVLTLQALAEFVLIPTWRFAAGADLMDSVYVHAMFLSLIGFAAFWAGSLVFMKQAWFRFVPRVRDTPSRVAFMSATMLGLGLIGNLVMWKAPIYSYTADVGLRESSVGFIQWFAFLTNLLDIALVVSAIEVLGKRSTKPSIKIIFWISVLCSVGLGLISGMKSGPLVPLVYLVLVYGITRGRIPRMAFILPLLLLLIYPFVNAYRNNLNKGYSTGVNSIWGMGAVLEKSFDDVVYAPASTSEQAGNGFDEATERLSLLGYVHDIIGLPDPSVLNDRPTIWLAPFYPLIPRFLWKNKPILDKGVRLSVALGRPATTSSAVTPIGDLYSMYGNFGLVFGMFIYGICLQLYMNRVGHGLISERGIFIYLSMLMPLVNFEKDVIGFVAVAVQTALILLLTSYVIYGRSASSLRVARYSSSMVAS